MLWYWLDIRQVPCIDNAGRVGVWAAVCRSAWGGLFSLSREVEDVQALSRVWGRVRYTTVGPYSYREVNTVYACCTLKVKHMQIAHTPPWLWAQ